MDSKLRRKKMRPSVSRREWLVVSSAGLTLAFTSWGLGGIPLWSLHVLLTGGIVTLVFALAPFPDDFRFPFSTLQFPLKSIKQLFTWPPFWFSLAFLVYLVVGALNPAAEVVNEEKGWWVRPIEVPLSVNLPTSVISKYQPMSAWRVIVSFTAAFTLIWGMWAGITRRKTALLIIWLLAISGSCMAFVAVLQHLTDATKVLWTFPSNNENFWGSFFYRNQGAAYLNLILVASGALFLYHSRKSYEHARSGGPHFLGFFLFAIVVTSVGLALSRGGILFASILSLSFLILVAINAMRGLRQMRSFWSILIAICLLLVGGFTITSYVDIDAIKKRFGNIELMIDKADQDSRTFSTRATWDMAQDRLWLGWGAGSFRYIFPMYQREYPKIYFGHYNEAKNIAKGRQMYRYAHNDVLQFIAEYGLIGTALVFGAVLALLAQAVYYSGRHTLVVLILFVGGGQAFAHAFLDFIFNSPAYWMAFVGLLAVAAKLLQLEFVRRT